MKKKYLYLLISFICTILSGCKTNYDDKQIVKIVYLGEEGMGIGATFIKAFDFETLRITKEAYLSENIYQELIAEYEESGNQAQIESFKAFYNQETLISNINKKDKGDFLDTIIKRGIYHWKDEYVTKEIICDGAGFRIEIHFNDGSVKSTYFYFKYPANFKKIQELFPKYFSTELSF